MDEYRDSNYRNGPYENSSCESGYHYEPNFIMTNGPGSWDNQNGFHEPPRKKFRRKSPPVTLTRKSLALLIVLCVLVSGAAGFGGAALAGAVMGGSGGTGVAGPVKTGSATSSGYTLEDATGSNMTVQEITEAAKASVVEITTESVMSDVWMQQYVTQGAGSGVIITSDGYIVTNNHVIENASKINVTTIDGESYEAKLIGADSITDIAVLKINAKNLAAATYGNSDQIAVGDLAVAIGNPLGHLGGTVTAGIISALDRQLSLDGKSMTLLQTDSSINPGNSGGGLFNDSGQLIGIVVAKSSGSDVEGLGFAIPCDKVASVAKSLIENGYVEGRPQAGITIVDLTDANAAMRAGVTITGVYISDVTGKNAQKAGLKKGDLIYYLDDTKITSSAQLVGLIQKHEVGDVVTFTVVRDNELMKMDVELELSQPQQAAEQTQPSTEG